MTFVYIVFGVLWATIIAAYLGWLPMPIATIYGDDAHF